MTNKRAISTLNSLKDYYNDKKEDSYVGFDLEDNEALDMAIKVLEQEQDEVILTKKEYGELVSSEFDNGYAKGFREALEEQKHILDKIRAEIGTMSGDIETIADVMEIIDKYKAEGSEDE